MELESELDRVRGQLEVNKQRLNKRENEIYELEKENEQVSLDSSTRKRSLSLTLWLTNFEHSIFKGQLKIKPVGYKQQEVRAI